MTTTKICRGCGIAKELNRDNFYRLSRSKNGFNPQCKKCVDERNRTREYPVIYKIVNVKNNKTYIGQTVQSLKTRYNQHFAHAKKDRSTPLHIDIKDQKFSKRDFSVEIIEHCLKEHLDNRERYWIDFYRNDLGESMVYNLQIGGLKDRIMSYDEKELVSRSLGTLDNILVYSWVNKKFIGRYFSCMEALDKNGLAHTPIRTALNEGYFIGKDMVFIYEFNHKKIDDIMSEIETKYSNHHNIKEIKYPSMAGENAPPAKLNECSVKNIIADLISGEKNGDIAKKYSISRQAVTDINYRRTWSHILIKGHEKDSVYNLRRRPIKKEDMSLYRK